MGHYCRICGKVKPNEKFSGKGHRNHICKACSRLPKEYRDRIDHLEEIYGYWQQKNISKKNIVRLSELSESKDAEVSGVANLLHEIGLLFPFKKKRIGRIAKEAPSLIPRMESVGFIHDWVYGDFGEAIEDSMDDELLLWDEYCAMENKEPP